ncbi:MAG TPA: fasciclin domain-containing protein [Phnomibacter sp.]|nr:fasciclin domain-containing protein [Phnomibacter sp.]
MNRTKMNKTFNNQFLTFGFILLLACWVCSCKKLDLTLHTTDDVNITGYFQKNVDSFSLFLRILERTETADYLNAYGTYTCFAPTNSAVKTFLANIGASSVETADPAILKDIVRFHLMESIVTTETFNDGKIPVVTMFGQYLIANVDNVNGSSRYFINRQAHITKTNERVGNGIIHIIDNVLIPAKKTLAKSLEENPDFSIFVQALKETGWFTLLDNQNASGADKKWYTVLAESNKALSDSGIQNFNALKLKYSQTGNPLLITDSLNIYCAYHILQGLKFMGDLVNTPTHITMVPLEVVSAKIDDQLRMLINDDVFNGVLEPGIELIRPKSDMASSNGVIHEANAHFIVKVRKPIALFWDVSDFEEIRKLPAYFRKATYAFLKNNNAEIPIKDITWPYFVGTNKLTYYYSTTQSQSSAACYNDINLMELGTSNRATYVDYRTPALVKGKYKVWVCYRSQKGSSNSILVCNVTIDSTEMPRTFAFTDVRPNGTDAELEAIGWKRYTGGTTSTSYAGRFVGTVEIKTTERHMLRIGVINGANSTNNLDMIHFIPVDDNQILPRFMPDGTKVYN